MDDQESYQKQYETERLKHKCNIWHFEAVRVLVKAVRKLVESIRGPEKSDFEA
jgi:hypothetical protein